MVPVKSRAAEFGVRCATRGAAVANGIGPGLTKVRSGRSIPRAPADPGRNTRSLALALETELRIAADLKVVDADVGGLLSC